MNYNPYQPNFGNTYGNPYAMPNYNAPQYVPQGQPMYQQAPQQQAQTQTTFQPQYMQKPNSNIEYVNGIEGAKALALPPNHTRLLIDSDSQSFFIKSTDNEGKPTIRVFSYTENNGDKPKEKVEMNFVTIEQFEDFKKEIFERLKGKQNVNKENRNERK